MNASHTLVGKSNEIFNLGIKPGAKEALFGSSEEIVAGGGTCGDFVHVAARALKTAGYKIRVAQMKVGETYGGHVFLEVLIDGGYRVLDPYFNVSYVNKSGELATFEEVSNNWENFRQQTPQNYNLAYSYNGVRYTNWDKVPIMMPLVKKGLIFFWGEATINHISIRAYLLEAYLVRMWLLCVLYLWVIVLTALGCIRRKKHPLVHSESIF